MRLMPYDCAGLTIDRSDFVDVLQSPKQVAAGVLLQYTIMPLLAFAISRLLPTPLAVGLILVGCCPGCAKLATLCALRFGVPLRGR